jgi:hypothetical protein
VPARGRRREAGGGEEEEQEEAEEMRSHFGAASRRSRPARGKSEKLAAGVSEMREKREGDVGCQGKTRPRKATPAPLRRRVLCDASRFHIITWPVGQARVTGGSLRFRHFRLSLFGMLKTPPTALIQVKIRFRMHFQQSSGEINWGLSPQ